MAQKNELATLVSALVITGALLGGGYWWFNRNSQTKPDIVTNASPPQEVNSPITFAAPTQVGAGTKVSINGSTSMVGINQALKKAFEAKFPGTTILTDAKGTDIGIKDLLLGTIDVAAVSSALSPQEAAQGLVSIPIAEDRIAIVVGLQNPYRAGLSQTQIQQIFEGKITNWSQVGGKPGTIRVINRPPVSGTHQAFKQLVLQGREFGITPNISTMERDATTPLLQALKTDGIGYATYAQIANQQTVRVVPVDGLTPEAANYPFHRILYYVYKSPSTPEVQVFLGFATSPEGRRAIAIPSP